jgi:hypothetical protein
MTSWVIVEKNTGKAVFETYSRKMADAVNRKKFNVLPILEYLQEFNRKVKEQKQKDEWLRKTNKEIRAGAV